MWLKLWRDLSLKRLSQGLGGEFAGCSGKPDHDHFCGHRDTDFVPACLAEVSSKVVVLAFRCGKLGQVQRPRRKEKEQEKEKERERERERQRLEVCFSVLPRRLHGKRGLW